MKYLEKLQSLLPLGYLYLIVMGLIKESIVYYQVGINIVNYSSITDILISPIADIVSSPNMVIMLFLLLLFFSFVLDILVRYRHKKWAKSILGQNRFSAETSKMEIYKTIFPFFIMFFLLEVLSVFIGIGVTEGRTLSKKIIKNDYKYNYKVDFSSGPAKDVYIFHKNSSYYFYVTKDDKNIKIAAMGTVSKLELIDNKKLK